MTEQLIGENWGKTERLSKIKIKKDFSFIGMDNTSETAKAGIYYISGFYANAMGLTDTIKKARNGHSDIYVPVMALADFYKVS